MNKTLPSPGISEYTDFYMKTLERLKNVILSGTETMSAKTKAAAKIIEIQKHIGELRKFNAKWAAKYIPLSYKTGFNQDAELLKKYLGSDYSATFSGLHQEAAKVLIEATYNNLNIVANAIESTYAGYISRIQLENKRAEIANRIAENIIEGQSRGNTVKNMLNTLKDQIVDGKITVGKVTMDAKSYADLLVRTETRAARTEGTLNRLKENEIDLVIISNTGAIDFCREYEDQIFSISGKSSKYPMLVERPPYHPNCKHTLSAFVEEFADEGDAEKGKQFDENNLGLSAREMAKKYPPLKQEKAA